MSQIIPTSLQIPLSILSVLFLTMPFHGSSQAITDSEQSILLRLKQYWSDPPPINHWTQSSNSTSTHCDWPEITCTNGSVTGLALINTDINGTVPPFICELKNLTVIDLQYNYFAGPFPTVLYNCSELEILDLSQNSFDGPIPGDIDRLSARLHCLNLSGNYFTGDIPAAIGRFPELRILRLFLNQFNGSFPPEISNLSSLEVLEMSFNKFAAMALPSSFTQLKKLKELRMRDMGLIGEIPETMGNLTALEVLDLSLNGLSGNIPSGLFLLKNLTILYLYNNSLSGAISPAVEALNLEVIDLSENYLTGTIPDDFGRLTKLSLLALFFNQLSGELPESIGRLPSLTVVKLFTNNFSGVLPPDFGRYSTLSEFQVSSNHFTGKLPEYLCAKGALIGVVAFDNQLTGELPNSLGNCRSLRIVEVYGNQLSESIPSGLWTSYNLTALMLNDNSFSGHLPDELATNLSRLEFSNNMFSGEIPAGVSSWKSLKVFSASNNHLTGTIPQGLTALPFLTTLLLDGNQLSGHLPPDIVSWKWLNILDLSRNQLSGPIPAKIGSLPSLTDLDLSGNEFSGQIPPQIGLLKLNSLNLSSNRLTGRIPHEFENTVFDNSFLNNSGLCATSPSLGLDVCASGPQNSSKISSWLLIMIVSIAAVMFVLAMLFVFFMVKTYRKRECGLDSKWQFTQFQTLSFSESDILSSLTESNVIGSGGSGKVYRVSLNRLGKVVAVKKTWNNRELDARIEKGFLAEAQILGTIRHPNIVKLLCYISNETTKLLVYEYLDNQSLDQWLHGKKRQTSNSGSVHYVALDWPKRLRIAVGIARGLCYMHHDCSPSVIHRDVKSSNILLDVDFNAKVADFGLAKMLVNHGKPNTMSVVAGTMGYLAPEYFKTSKVTEKIDVYSFGVVLLELVTGRKANNNGDEATCLADNNGDEATCLADNNGDEATCLAEWACRHVQDGNPIVDALDEEVKEPCYLDEMTCVYNLGIICTDLLPSTRPSMKEVLQTLLHCGSHQPALGEKIVASENDGTPLLKNSRRERLLHDEDCSLASNV